MATKNQIALKQAKEQERSNRAKERISIAELNEKIQNNKVINKINFDKNLIQKLANEQLNDRELKKLNEEINLAYDQLNETAYNNDVMKVVNQEKHKLDEMIANAKNDTEIQKASINSMSNLFKGIFSLLDFNSNIKAHNLLLAYNTLKGRNNDQGSIVKLDLYPWQTGSPETDGSYNYDYNKRSSDYAEERRNANGQDSQSHTAKKVESYQQQYPSRQAYYKRKKDEDEIPEDFSSSNGPGFETERRGSLQATAIVIPSINNGPTNQRPSKHDFESDHSSGRHGTTSGGTNYNVSGGHKSTGTIISPGANF